MCRLVTINSWSLWVLNTAAQSCYLLLLNLLPRGLLPIFTTCLKPLNQQPPPLWDTFPALHGNKWNSSDHQSCSRPNPYSLLSPAFYAHTFLLVQSCSWIPFPLWCYSTSLHEYHSFDFLYFFFYPLLLPIHRVNIVKSFPWLKQKESRIFHSHVFLYLLPNLSHPLWDCFWSTIIVSTSRFLSDHNT